MKQKSNISLITIFLSMIITVLVLSILFFACYVYNREVLSKEKDIIPVSISDKQEKVITTKLPEDNEELQVVSIKPIAEPQDNGNTIQTNLDKFYYSQLDEYSKMIYDSLNDNKGNLKTGIFEINLPRQIAEFLKTEEGTSKIESIFSIAINAFEYDNPDIFYVDFSKMVLYYESDSLGNCNAYIKNDDRSNSYLLDGFNTKEDINKAEKEIDAIVEELKNTANNLQRDYDKIKYIHDWIVKNTKYDETLNRTNRNNIYGLLIEKDATCGGYAKTFKYIMDKLNINSIIIQGKASQEERDEYHAWNYIQLDNKWYGIDCTWDDPIVQGVSEEQKRIYYEYFLKGQSAFDKHIRFDSFYGTDLKINYPEVSVNNY